MDPKTLPPYTRLSSRPISLSAASTLLTTYITNSESHPYLHPDALITPAGVTFSTHGGPSGGVVMHALRRVAAGLRGEVLEPERTPSPEPNPFYTGPAKNAEGEDRPDVEPSEEDLLTYNSALWKGKKRKAGDQNGEDEDPDGWQNMSEYEREEGQDVIGEIGDRSNFVESAPNPDGVVDVLNGAPVGTQDGQDQATGGAGLVTDAKKKRVRDSKGDKVDKDARKKAKKEREKERKRDKEKKRATKD